MRFDNESEVRSTRPFHSGMVSPPKAERDRHKRTTPSSVVSMDQAAAASDRVSELNTSGRTGEGRVLMLAVHHQSLQMEFVRFPQSVTAPVGTDVTFECAVNVPGERLAWRRKSGDGQWQELKSDDGGKGISTMLTINVRDDTQSAFYQCVVWYGAISLASIPGRLTVARLVAPEEGDKRTVTSPLGNTVVLHCRTPKSDPPAVLTWWKEEKGIKNKIRSPYRVLVLPNVTAADSGAYGCTANNELSGQSVELLDRIYLRVQQEPRTAPRFLETDDYVGTVEDGVITESIKVNEALRLWCGVVGDPVPPVTWSRRSNSLPNRTHVDGNYLTVAYMRPENEGIYTCSAGHLQRSWRVSVLQPPRFEGSAENVNGTEGGRAHVSCGTPKGTPTPVIQWMLNAQALTPGGDVRIHGQDIYIEHLEKRHAGIVQCFACNELGCAYDAVLLTVVPVQIMDQNYDESDKLIQMSSQSPKRHNKKNSRKHKANMVPPSRPNVTRMSDESVMVTWSAGNYGLPIQLFKVQHREGTNSGIVQWQTSNRDIPPYVNSYLVTGLIPDRYYKFRIAAVYSNQDNKLGRSSPRFYLKRGEFPAPRAPVLVRAVPLSPTRIELEWTWSMGQGGVQAEGFYVYYRPVSSAGEYEKGTAAGGPAARAAQLTHLAADTAYELKLQAYTAQAPSEFSTIKVAKTLKVSTTLVSKATDFELTTTEVATVADVDSGNGSGGMLVTAGGALGAVLLLIGAVLTLLLCRRARKGVSTKEKASRPQGGANGYIPAKVPITITANPLHAEGGDAAVEMSFMHNNNCGNTSDDSTSRKNTAPRNYV
ncbi:Interference hedgehog [Eumeta japonica]|uniref:Interference hedgehog n=1 Tax=Eumeta variegata TaxID=151549 RepID=A0A4C1ZSV7_EUMVA|nr:Interference hedgehog [Eumeta japonica]